jgi:peptidoglycan-associated lipoprotein
MGILKTIAMVSAVVMLSACSTMSGMNDNSNDSCDKTTHELSNKVGDRVFFEFDSSGLTSEAQETLRSQAAYMDQNPNLKFTVEGHCDEKGTREYNMALGERRANAAKKYLETLGVGRNRLTTVSYGKERPAVAESNEWAWSQNRRSVTVAD